MMFCKNCAEVLTDGDIVCPSCGFAAGTGTKYCGSCGTMIMAGAIVCEICGNPIPQLGSSPRMADPNPPQPTSVTFKPFGSSAAAGSVMMEDIGAVPTPQPTQTFGQTNAYGQPQSTAGTDAFGQQNSFGQTNAYGQPNAYGQTNAYGQPNAYGQTNAYGQSNAYGQTNAYGNPQAGYVPQAQTPAYFGESQKSRTTAGILGLLLGMFGVHNFYLGYTGKAVAQLLLTLLSCFLLSFIPAIWGMIEGIMLLAGGIEKDGNGLTLKD